MAPSMAAISAMRTCLTLLAQASRSVGEAGACAARGACCGTAALQLDQAWARLHQQPARLIAIVDFCAILVIIVLGNAMGETARAEHVSSQPVPSGHHPQFVALLICMRPVWRVASAPSKQRKLELSPSLREG